MASEPRPSNFPDTNYVPSAWGETDTSNFTNAITYPTPQDTPITFPNEVGMSALKTNTWKSQDGTNLIDYVTVNNVLNVQKNISGANISGAVLTGITSMSTPLLSVTNTGTIVTLKTDSIKGSDNGAILSYDTATETTTVDSFFVKIPNTLKTNSIEKNTDSKLDIGVGVGSIIRIGTTTSQSSNLDTITIGSLTSSVEMVGTVFTEKIRSLSPSSAVDLFPNVTSGSFSVGSGITTGSMTIGNESVTVSIPKVLSSTMRTNDLSRNNQTANVKLYNGSGFGVNVFTDTGETFVNNQVKIGKNGSTLLLKSNTVTVEGNIVISGASSTAVTPSVGDSSTKIATTAFVQGEIAASGGGGIQLNQANTFTALQSFTGTAGGVATNTLRPTQSEFGVDIKIGLINTAFFGLLALQPSGTVTLRPKNDATDNGVTAFSFQNTSGVECGRIRRLNSTTIAYETSSDRRMKDDIVDMRPMTETIMKMKPREYNWKSSGTSAFGLIAQELFEVLPHTKPDGYTEEPVFEDEEGNQTPNYYGIDYGSLTPYLLKCLQECVVRIQQLEAKNPF